MKGPAPACEQVQNVTICHLIGAPTNWKLMVLEGRAARETINGPVWCRLKVLNALRLNWVGREPASQWAVGREFLSRQILHWSPVGCFDGPNSTTPPPIVDQPASQPDDDCGQVMIGRLMAWVPDEPG